MAEKDSRIIQLSPLKRALLKIEQLQERVDELAEARAEPLAIVGMACRFPGGARDLDRYWQLLEEGVDAVGEVPPERWDIDAYYDPDPEKPGKMYTRYGSFLEDVDQFDARFFRISPREARRMDPQHRLLLEVSWEALEDAGLTRRQLRGSATGVFVGITTNDYAHLQLAADAAGLDGYFFTGNPLNAAAGRISYTLGLEGPSLAVDTACSSSLVALHQACQSLRAGECDVAIAGGANLVLAPETTVAVCRTGALAADGRCKTFDAAADGFVRGEGCGALVLKRLSRAKAAGDRIWAVVRGSAVNQDGASSGFTAPSGPAQQALIRRALGALPPAAIDYVEAHGTGTALGDPIEVEALGAVFAADRDPNRPLFIGSVKTNLGHLEAAAGMAGVIKVVLALHRGQLPPHLHCDNPSPLIDWERLPVEVCRQIRPWPAADGPRRAGVSAFGASGTNAHVVLEEAAPDPDPVPNRRSAHPLLLSAQTPAALQAMAARYAAFLQRTEEDLDAIAHTAATARTHFRHRLGLTAASRAEAQERLEAFADKGQAPGVMCGEAAGTQAPRLAFLFTGQGAQRAGMGRELYEGEPRFRQVIERCDEVLCQEWETSLVEVLYGAKGALLEQTAYAQAALFALECGLVEVLRDWGVEPRAVLGHSLGEYAAACAAGVFSLEEGVRLVARRGRLMQALPAGGAMAALLTGDEERVAAALEERAAEMAIAAFNGESITISGRRAAVEAVCAALGQEGVESRPLSVSHAFHSPLLEPALDDFEREAAAVEYHTPLLPLVSNVDGAVMDGPPGAAYWRRHSRAPVRFAAGIETLAELGCNTFVEIGPRPQLTSLGRRCRPDGRWLATLGRSEEEWRSLLECAVALHVEGAEVAWEKLSTEGESRHVRLPHYPFERRSHWIERGTEMDQEKVVQNAAAGPARQERILASLLGHMARLLQTSEAEVDAAAPFLEMGADSLVLVEAVRLIEDEFGLQMTIRQFFEDAPTVAALAAFIDARLPQESVSGDPSESPSEAAVPTLPALPLSPPVGEQTAEASGLERVLIEQNRVMAQFMAQQMEMLRALPSGGSAPPSQRPGPAPKAVPPTPMEPAEQKTRLPWGEPVELRQSGLDARQQEHLEALIERYVARTQRSKELTQQHRASLADSRAAVGFRFTTKEMLYPLWGERAEGARLWDVDGNEYIDFTMGFGVHLCGHKPPFVQRALEEEVRDGVELGMRSQRVGQVAELMCALTGLERVAFCNSGTEAVMAAMRLARAATGRDKIALFAHSYHGHADATLARARVSGGVQSTVPVAGGVPAGAVEDVLVLDYGDEESLQKLRACAGELAAVMVEPVQSRNLALQPRDFLQALRQLTEEVGAALIFDEMITGFRVHPGGAQAHFGVRADLATYGKILGGGVAIGAVAGAARFMDGIDGGPWQYGDGSFPASERTAFGGTFCQHPLAMAAAHAMLSHLRDEGPQLQARLNERTAVLARRLNELFERQSAPIEVAHFGSLFRFEFKTNLELFFYHLLERGIYIWEWRSCFLSTAHGEEEVEAFALAVEESVEALRQGGFLPTSGGEPAAAGEEESGGREDGRVPLSEAQKQLWALAQVSEAGSAAYNEAMCLELRGPLQVQALGAALAQLAARHQALRGRVDAEGAHLLIDDEVGPPLEVVEAVGAAAAEAWLEAEVGRPFDLAGGPLLRAGVARLAEDRHLFLLVAHHIVCDGWSFAVMVEELSALYTAASSGAGATLEAALPFSRYLSWQRAQRHSAAMAGHEQYWLERFAGDLPSLDLPADRPRPARRSYRGKRHTQHLDGALFGALERAARDNGCTLFMLLLAGYQVLLRRLSGQREVVVGVPVAGRGLRGCEGMVGYCTHLLPVRTDVDLEQPFADFLLAVRAQLLDAFDHQDYPFAWLLERLREERGAAADGLVATTFNLDVAADAPPLQGLETKLGSFPVRHAKFDLGLNVTEVGGELVLDWDYSTDLFDAETVARWSAYFHNLLVGATANCRAPLGALPLMDADEERHSHMAWNATARDYGGELRIPQLFAAQVSRSPEAVAVRAEEGELTYAELDRRANCLAHFLRRRGVGPDVLVGICAERSLELMVGLLGVLKAGGAYVPLDPEYPAARLGHMLADAQVGVLLTQERLVERLPEHAAEVVLLDSDQARLDAESGADPGVEVGPDHLAYAIYTSGSTGAPKCALNTHGAIGNRLLWMQEAYGLTAADRVLQKTPFSFDVSVIEFFWPLLAGARLVMARPGGHRDSRYLVEVVRREQITTLHFVPSMLQFFVEEEQLPQCTSLRRVTCSGEALAAELMERFLVRSGAELHNLYGPTEAAVDVSYWACRRGGLRGSVPIGRPIANTQLWILDEALRPVPTGVAGELFIGGVGLARGYHRRPGLTAEKFIPDPFGDGGRLYRTGDLARWLPQGQLEFLGRLDHQVKIRGLRVELGEVEAELNACASIRESAVVSRQQRGEAQLLAYVVAERPLVLSQVRQELRQRLPEYMVPAAFVVLEALPLSANGKLDRRALPEPEELAGEERVAYRAPTTPVEEVLAAVWGRVLGAERVGLDDDFFALGGHSLLALKAATLAGKQLERRVELRAFFDHPTLGTLAAFLEQGGTALAPVEPLPLQEDYPLSEAQRRFWVQEQVEGDSFNLPAAFLLEGEVRGEWVEQAFAALVERHEILRTVFPRRDGQPRQRVLPAAACGFAVEQVDLSGAVDAAAAVAELLRRQAAERMDLEEGPLLRLRLARLDGRRHACLCTLHHIVSDGWSVEILLDEFQQFYDGLAAGSAAPLPPLRVQYKDCAAWADGLLEGEEGARLRAYWTAKLGGDLARLELPTDAPRAPAAAYRRRVRDFALPAAAVEALVQCCQERRATPFMGLMAALKALLFRHTAAADIAVGTPCAGRVHADMEDQLGPFLNVLVLRDQLAGEQTFAQLLEQVRHTALDAFAHQLFPFAALIEALGAPRQSGRNPLFDVGFTLQNQGDVRRRYRSSHLQVRPWKTEEVEADRAEARTDLWFLVEPGAGDWSGALVYNGALFTEETAARLSEDWVRIIEAVGRDAETPLGRLPVGAASARPQAEKVAIDMEF